MPTGVYERTEWHRKRRFGNGGYIIKDEFARVKQKAEEAGETFFDAPEPCLKCGTHKRYTVNARCIVCIQTYAEQPVARNTVYKRKFGITIDDYEKMLKEQNGVCAICAQADLRHGGRRLAVDHNHDTGEVRGLLCGQCNTALGGFNDDPALIKKAMEYLYG